MNGTLILQVDDLKKYFLAEKTGIWSSGDKQVFALDGVSLELKKGRSSHWLEKAAAENRPWH